MKTKTRTVEYYRLWNSAGMGTGQWDTDTIEIPADTPDDKVDNAIQTAVNATKWRNDEPPVIMGFYADCDDNSDEDDTTEV